MPLRVVHQRAAAPDSAAVVLLHGWPDSVLRFSKVLPLLTDVHVVVPALPGYPFAAPIAPSRISAATMATAVAATMTELGYDRYVVSAGDVGTRHRGGTGIPSPRPGRRAAPDRPVPPSRAR